ncbi:hypothetical protein G7B40_022145 [Aetokthonos hydrillicola Thurmond2011]|jgi:hypothetical protein|uniref:Uncharacterized protein n=1 Tax=Aetokthonos hydrillicola Thurmond2011 TaxID=2712845 RepID=A0AAP5M9H8_9CYAN|nr:hypothetical protein [Aetokthonos hydrillicola]MBO3460812.1 hypothetical protein [Aetokthonos hydrillicola CCALA 1050]MBW4588275.1 hypothetical protein [Aetokthonos hydrillicola CCALA 1050]MDR9897245.1 hypothetical protein [Aetokthonos hydrillicola Thurmond2011]
MENWQFLIQKQGDRSWHSLESPKVEIIEGMYRIVTRSGLPNINVEVRVIYSSTLEVPPKRRIQKRSRRTTEDGLMVVIPYTYLKAGIWELQCCGDLISDNLRKSWQYSICLVVLPNLSLAQKNTWGQPAPPLSSEGLNPVIECDDQVVIDDPVSPVWLKADTAEEILKSLVSLALPPSEPLLEEEISLEDSLPVIALPLLLTLEQETYITSWGETLTVNGRVEPEQINYVLDDRPNCERVYNGELKIQLSSPDTSEILAQERQPLPEEFLPFSIQVPIEIPSECKSKLILADITLYGSFVTAGEPRVLAHQSFTITANVAELLAITTATQTTEPDVVDNLEDEPASHQEAKPSAPIKLELFNLVKTVKKTEPNLLATSPKKSLPPQLVGRQIDKTPASPQLPQLPKQNIYKINVPAILPANRRTSISTTFPYLRRVQVEPDHHQEAFGLQYTNTIEADYEDIPYQKDSFGEEFVPSHNESVAVGNTYLSPLIKKWVHTQGHSSPQPLEDNEDKVISSEHLFEEQVQEVSENEALSEKEWEEPIPADIITSLTDLIDELSFSLIDQSSMTSPTTVIAEVPTPKYVSKPSPALAQEIVVYDTYIEAETDILKKQTSKQEQKSVSDLPPITEPLAIPQLHIPEGELIAGKSIRVIVQIPGNRSQVAVKLWVEDCQTRWLLDAPRLLKNLLPNYEGKLEVITHINVPFGCLEIRVEAIAVDMVTKQESHKASIHRTVIPPDLLKSPVDELFLSI